MLRKLIGIEAFWAGVRDYYARHRETNVTTDEFRQAMEKSSGMTLGWFFQQWLKRPGTPTVEGNWRYHADAKRLDIDLTQAQSADPYRLPIEVGIQLEGAPEPRIEPIEMTERKQHFEIKLDKPPLSVALDLNCWVLMKSRLEQRTVH